MGGRWVSVDTGYLAVTPMRFHWWRIRDLARWTADRTCSCTGRWHSFRLREAPQRQQSLRGSTLFGIRALGGTTESPQSALMNLFSLLMYNGQKAPTTLARPRVPVLKCGWLSSWHF